MLRMQACGLRPFTDTTKALRTQPIVPDVAPLFVTGTLWPFLRMQYPAAPPVPPGADGLNQPCPLDPLAP